MSVDIQQKNVTASGVSLTIAIISMLISVVALSLQSCEARKANPQISGSALQALVTIELTYTDELGGPGPASPGILMNVAQVSNVGRSPSSVSGVSHEELGMAQGFAQVDGSGDLVGTWNDPVRVEAGSSVYVVSYAVIWQDVCSVNSFENCPVMSMNTVDDDDLPFEPIYRGQEACTRKNKDAACARLASIAEGAQRRLRGSELGCRQIASMIVAGPGKEIGQLLPLEDERVQLTCQALQP